MDGFGSDLLAGRWTHNTLLFLLMSTTIVPEAGKKPVHLGRAISRGIWWREITNGRLAHVGVGSLLGGMPRSTPLDLIALHKMKLMSPQRYVHTLMRGRDSSSHLRPS